MERRAFLGALAGGLLAAPLAAAAQQAGKVYRIGFLRAGEPPKFWIDEFREGLRELGYVEGQNVVIEFRIGPLDQLPQLAEDLVRSKVDVIVASASSAGMAAKKATTSIPIVFTSLSHPVEIGLIKSLAHPGGNITGVTVNAGATVTKRLELLRERSSQVPRDSLPPTSRSGQKGKSWTTTTFAYSCARDWLPAGAGHQPQDRESAGPDLPAIAPAAGGPGD